MAAKTRKKDKTRKKIEDKKGEVRDAINAKCIYMFY